MLEERTWRLLIADDNPVNRDILMRMIQRDNFEIIQVDNGGSALDILRAEYFDVVLLDIMMPVMTGYEVLEHLRADEELRYLPVIVISAVSDMESIVHCIQMGAEDYLLKPFNKTLLKARLEAILEKKYFYDQLQLERKKADQLLLNILPQPIAVRLKDGEEPIADNHEDVSVMFADLVNFTQLATRVSPRDLVTLLNTIFSRFDYFCEKYEVEKIKTVGDSYIAVGNLLVSNVQHQQAIAHMALDMASFVREYNHANQSDLAIRIGLHCGPVVAGVLGKQKFFYDLWGETVNIASRLETYSDTGRIHVSQAFYDQIKDFFVLEARGELEMKGLDTTSTYFLIDEK